MTRAVRSVGDQPTRQDGGLSQLWEVCIPTLRLDADRTVRGCQI